MWTLQDEVVALRKRISELEEEAQSRVRAPQEDELPATIHVSTAAEINQLRVTVQDLQREPDFFEIGDGEESSAIDFGQLRLRPALFFEFGQFAFGQFRLRPILTSANSWMLNFGTTKGGALKGGAKGGAQKGGAPKGGAQNFALFFPSSHHNFLSSFSLGFFSWNFGGV